MPRFTIPLLLTVEADSYDEAFEYADDLAAVIRSLGCLSICENISAEHVSQHLRVEAGEPHQYSGRVLYFTDLGV